MAVYDPLKRVDALLSNPIRELERRRQKKSSPAKVELTPAATESLVKSVGNSALGGIAKAGNLLDLPGSMVRDAISTLSGKAANPFDQLLTPFSDENRTSGRDLLEHWGVSQKNKPGLDWGDAAGFAADILLDPTTYLTGGAAALGKGGKLAKAAGLLDDAVRVASKVPGKTVGPRIARMTTSLDDLLRAGGREAVGKARSAAKAAGFDSLSQFRKAHGQERLGGLLGVGLPFREPSKIVGALDDPFAPSVAKTVAQGLDRVGGAIKQSAPVRTARSLFDSRVKGQVGKYGQELAENISKGELSARAKGRIAGMEAVEQVEEAYKMFDEAFGDTIRNADGMKDVPGAPVKSGDIVRAKDRGNYGYVQRVTPDGAEVYFRNPETGSEAVVPFKHADNMLSVTSATEAQMQSLDAARSAFHKIARVAAETGDLQKGFDEFADGLKPSPEVEKAMRGVVDNMVSAKDGLYKSVEALGGQTSWMQGLEGTQHFPRQAHEKVLKKSEATRLASTTFANMQKRTPELRSLPTHVVNKISKDRAVRSQGAGYILEKYGEHLEDGFDNGFQYVDEAGKPITGKAAHAQALTDWAKQHKPGELFTRSMTEDFSDYMVGGNMAANTIKAIHSLFIRNAAQAGDDGIELGSALQRMYLNPDRALKTMAEQSGRSIDQLRQLKVPAEVVKDAQGFVEFMNKPKWASAVTDTLDEVTRVIKESLTMPWPSFAGRNFTSGQFVNLTSGAVATPGDLKEYARAVKDVWQLRKGGDPQLLRELEAFDVIGQRGFLDTDLHKGAGQGILPASPLDVRQSYRDAAQNVADNPGALDRLPGAKSVRRGYRTVTGAGGRLNQQVEWLNRAPMYLYLKRKGFSPEAAAKKVFELQFNYSQLAPFEKQVMRRAMPFYAFTRFSAPLVLKTLSRHPGGSLSQTIQATAQASGSDATTPAHIADTTSIPLGEQEDGSKRYLAGLGLAHEVPLGFLNGPQEIGLNLLSMSHPLAKGPLEWATGQSFFQRGLDGGRPLDDLDPNVGRMIANVKDRFTGEQTRDAQPFISGAVEHALANSPASRALSTARMFSDPRKGLGTQAMQFLTGLRVADVSPAVQERTLAEKAEHLLKQFPESRQYAKTYIPVDAMAEMTPEERLAALQYQALVKGSGGGKAKPKPKRRRKPLALLDDLGLSIPLQ